MSTFFVNEFSVLKNPVFGICCICINWLEIIFIDSKGQNRNHPTGLLLVDT